MIILSYLNNGSMASRLRKYVSLKTFYTYILTSMKMISCTTLPMKNLIAISIDKMHLFNHVYGINLDIIDKLT